VVPWPLQSPDLNIIENVWKLWKDRLRNRFMNADWHYIKRELWTACEEKWDAIEQDKINTIIKTMSQHIDAIIEAEGGYMKW
ncbi:hypothetical protein L873DRAFT_1715455, partial [Choiromyces venosus 120613-1]